jgi:cell division protein FtsB
MRFLAIAFALLIALLQYPLWLGEGGWARVWETDRQLTAQRAKNATQQTRNEALAAEVTDLRVGHEAIEERARFGLGMVKQDEVFFQLADRPSPGSTPR